MAAHRSALAKSGGEIEGAEGGTRTPHGPEATSPSRLGRAALNG